ncbi:MAG: TIGR03986 family CRISPR-associated RAMP protein, partial [Actinomyces sp.]
MSEHPADPGGGAASSRWTIEDVSDDGLIIRSHDDGRSHQIALDALLTDLELTPHLVSSVVDGEFDDGIFLLHRLVPGLRVERRLVGRPKSRRLKVDGFEQRIDFATVAAALQVDEGLLAALEGHEIAVLVGDDDRATLLPLDAELAAELAAAEAAKQAERQRQREEQERKRRRHELDENLTSEERFVNPYTFVGLPGPEGMQRELPAGHDRLAPGRLSGRLEVTWRAHTPILYRQPNSDGTWSTWTHKGRPGLPGSSIKGAVRSIHETLFGGCMRVVDLDTVAVYREPARVNTGKLAVVREHDPHTDTLTVELCDDQRWIRHDVLLQVLGDPSAIRTGARLSIHSAPDDKQLGRDLHLNPNGISADPDGKWVLLVTDAGARRAKRPVWYVVGHLSGKQRTIERKTLERYRREAAGSDDERLGLTDEVEVRFNNKTLGWRQPVRRDLPPGTVIWLRDDGRIARATIWRRAGEHPVRDRLDPAWRPCGAEPHTGDELCPSCRLFGSAGDEAPHSGADRRAINYRSHIRFGPARAAGDVRTERTELAPLGTPRVSSGQFYLDPPPKRNLTDAETDTPLAHWGSRADRPTPRRIRGRKYYWHGLNDRHRTRDHHTNNKMVTKVELLPAGTELRASIHFSGLTPVEVGQLIAAIDPARVLTEHRPHTDIRPRPGPVRSRLGGGRPFGFGTVEVTSLVVADLHDATSRYTGADAPPDETDHWVAAAVDATPEPVRETWPQLAAALTDGWAPAERIWYPPGATWDRKGTQAFDQSYEFFAASDGRHYPRVADRPLIRLPDADDPDPTLP